MGTRQRKGMKGCGDWRRMFQAEETAGVKVWGVRRLWKGRAPWTGAGFRAALEQPLVLESEDGSPPIGTGGRKKSKQTEVGESVGLRAES